MARSWLWALLVLAGFGLLHWGGADEWIAGGFYDPIAQGFPARNAWWARDLLHTGGRWLVIGVALATLLALAASLLSPRWRTLRAGSVYVLLCMGLITGGVALNKRYSTPDCPWDLQEYGGTRTHYRLLEPRPAAAAPGHCFPGGHSSGAFSLLAFHFLWRVRRPRAARWALLAALTLGLAYAVTQWARGAHFPSHDLASALIAWTVCSSLDRWRVRRVVPGYVLAVAGDARQRLLRR